MSTTEEKYGLDLDVAQKSHGLKVQVSDGEPKPPAHHTRKLREWEFRNYTGTLVEVESRYQPPYATINVVDTPHYKCNKIGVCLSKIRLVQPELEP